MSVLIFSKVVNKMLLLRSSGMDAVVAAQFIGIRGIQTIHEGLLQTYRPAAISFWLLHVVL
jgi:hypothetical protein